MKPEDQAAFEAAWKAHEEYVGSKILSNKVQGLDMWGRALAHRDAQPAVAQEPVHFRAVICKEQQEQALGVVPKIVGFVDKKAAEQFILEQRDFKGWKYNLEPLYTEAPAVAQGEADGWHFKFNSGAESFVTNVDAADLIRMGLQAGETCTEYFKKAITAEVGLSKTETTTEAPAVAQEPLDVLREVVSQYKQMNEWRMRHQCDSPELGAEEKELLHRAALAIAISAAEKVLDAQPAVAVNEQLLKAAKSLESSAEECLNDDGFMAMVIPLDVYLELTDATTAAAEAAKGGV